MATYNVVIHLEPESFRHVVYTPLTTHSTPVLLNCFSGKPQQTLLLGGSSVYYATTQNQPRLQIHLDYDSNQNGHEFCSLYQESHGRNSLHGMLSSLAAALSYCTIDRQNTEMSTSAGHFNYTCLNKTKILQRTS